MVHVPRLATLALLALLAPLAGAQSLAPATRPVAPAPPSILAAYQLRSAQLQRLEIEPEGKGWKWAVHLDGEMRTVFLREHDMRAKDYRLLVEDAHGIHEEAAGPITTFRGACFPGGHLVAAGFDGQRLHAWTRIGEEIWAAQTLSAAERASTGYELIVSRGADSLASGTCGTATTVTPAGSTSNDGGGLVRYETEIAIDCDSDFWRRNGRSTTACQDSVFAHMNAVDAIYYQDVDVVYSITTVLVRTTNTYAWNDDMGRLLNDFRSRWNAQHGNIRRDIAHLFTGKGNFGGTVGIAWVGVICSSNRGYAVSKVYDASFPTLVELIAHELGHNWGSGHCSGTSCRIMCSGLGGCSGVTNRFSSTSISAIESHRNSRGCLRAINNSVPNLATVSPSGAQAWGGEFVEVQGSELRGVTSVSLASNPLEATQFAVLGDDAIRIRVPRGLTPGAVPISAVNAVGVSNAVSLNVLPTDPPQLEASTLLVSGSTFEYAWGGTPGSLFTIALTVNDPATVTLFGDTILARGFPIVSGVFGPNGIGEISTITPDLSGLILYHQLWQLSVPNAAWAGSSLIRRTVFW